MHEAKFHLCDLVYHKASHEPGIVIRIAARCTVHTSPGEGDMCGTREDCKLEFDGTYDLSIGLGKVAEDIFEEVLELSEKQG